jgi:uncharacterized protein YbjQ (UPF0145 family)
MFSHEHTMLRVLPRIVRVRHLALSTTHLSAPVAAASGMEEGEIHVTTREAFAQFDVVQELGPVTGSTTTTTSWVGDVSAAVMGMFDGEMAQYTGVVERAQESARARALSEARALGANGVVNLHYRQSIVMGRIIAGLFGTVLCKGTAVVIVPKAARFTAAPPRDVE